MDDDYVDGWSQINVDNDEQTQVHSARSSLTVTHPSTSRGRRCLTSVNGATELALVATVSLIWKPAWVTCLTQGYSTY